jgi:hypothetical protein
MIALLSVYPIRLKNFAALEVGRTFKEFAGSWWITLPRSNTKSRRPDQRRVATWLNSSIHYYLSEVRPMLLGKKTATNFLWISSTTGQRMTTKNLGTLISKITLQTLGVDVSPHLFRTCAASTASFYALSLPQTQSRD